MPSHTVVPEGALLSAVEWLVTRVRGYVADGPAAAGASGIPPPIATLSELSRRLGLSLFEQRVLLLCAAPEFAPELPHLYAQVQGDPSYAFPTFALAFALFEDASWDALSPDRPLRYWRLIEIQQPPTTPLTTRPLRADERIVHYLNGLNQLDHRLRPFLLPVRGEDAEPDLPPSQQGVVDQALAYLAGAQPVPRWPILQLVGSDPISKRLVARRIAAQLGVQLYSLPAQLIPLAARDLEDLARLWHRESTLLPLALYLDASELAHEAPSGDPTQRVRQFLYRSDGLCMLDTRDVWCDLGRDNCALDVRKPTPGEQLAAWAAVLTPGMDGLPAQLAAQFDLNLPTVHEIVRGLDSSPSVAPQTGTGDQVEGKRLWQACLAYTRPRLDVLAQRITPVATWADIVLPEHQLRSLRHIAEQVEQRSKVYEEWGFRRRSSRGLGITVLFSGESGTGKTMAAEILANHLELNLYRIDLSAVVSKYIGETEKNLRRLFDAAEDGGALLFFDEADALFGKRSEVRDSHDRYANIEVSYLLQRLEEYRGLAILATNFKAGLDEAFTRRLRFSIVFPQPDEGYRQRIWEQIYPPETPVDGLDYAYLARTFRLSGGSIRNIALNAAFIAAHHNSPVTMVHVLEAARIEIAKEGRLLNEGDFTWEGARE
ncbi:MAG: ATP-binding protein [Anaerolineae bacterium]|nr:ATP-binding protein [Anaerolineae bacterium]